jgi:hypothetical protein
VNLTSCWEIQFFFFNDWFLYSEFLADVSQTALQYINTPADLNIPISFSVQAAGKALEH